MHIALGLKTWFLKNKRDFPWRKGCSPYQIWISEIMLQQTQASVVVPYFQRWITRFPNIEDLASAPYEEVLKYWEGLGYYSRVRNLQKGAQYIVRNHGGQLPDTKELLLSIPGIGEYTAGAILSFAFHKKGLAIDGNVKRVLSRYFLIEKEISSKEAHKEVETGLEYFLAVEQPHVVMEGLIELGAVICKKQPGCFSCPLKEGCRAFQTGRMEELPLKGKRKKTEEIRRNVFIILCQNRVLVKREKEKKIMADLWEFPYIEVKRQLSLEEEMETIKTLYPGICRFVKTLSIQKHTFTSFRSTLFPAIWEAGVLMECPAMEWIDLKEIERLSFSSGHCRILADLKKEVDCILNIEG